MLFRDISVVLYVLNLLKEICSMPRLVCYARYRISSRVVRKRQRVQARLLGVCQGKIRVISYQPPLLPRLQALGSHLNAMLTDVVHAVHGMCLLSRYKESDGVAMFVSPYRMH